VEHSAVLRSAGDEGVEVGVDRAQACVGRAGFKVEGVLRDALLWEGERVDEIVMSMLASEWIPSQV
jgi:hypothetical protein